MQSKTSCFNLTLLRKNVIRFSPLWIVYSAAWFVAMPLLLGMQLSSDWPPKLNDVIQILGRFHDKRGACGSLPLRCGSGYGCVFLPLFGPQCFADALPAHPAQRIVPHQLYQRAALFRGTQPDLVRNHGVA